MAKTGVVITANFVTCSSQSWRTPMWPQLNGHESTLSLAGDEVAKLPDRTIVVRQRRAVSERSTHRIQNTRSLAAKKPNGVSLMRRGRLPIIHILSITPENKLNKRATPYEEIGILDNNERYPPRQRASAGGKGTIYR